MTESEKIVNKALEGGPRDNTVDPDAVDVQKYVDQIHDLGALIKNITNYGLFVSRVSHFGRWLVVSGAAYWAVDTKTHKPLPPEFFRGQLENFMADLGITQFRISVDSDTTRMHSCLFQLGIPKSQIETESWQTYRNNESPDDMQLPEALNPDDSPEVVLKTHETGIIVPELERLGFVPIKTRSTTKMFGEQLQAWWDKGYMAQDGLPHQLRIAFVNDDTLTVGIRFEGVSLRPLTVGTIEPKSWAAAAVIIRDLDAAMKRSSEDSLPYHLEKKAIRRVLDFHAAQIR